MFDNMDEIDLLLVVGLSTITVVGFVLAIIISATGYGY